MVLRPYLEEDGRLYDFSYELLGRFRLLDNHRFFEYT
jgi:hypothetical protein